MTCKLPHNDFDWIEDGGLPEFLCRACHPEYNQTPESNAKFYADLRERQQADQAKLSRERDIRKCQMDIEAADRQARNEIVSLAEKIEDLNRDPDAKESTITELQTKLDGLREYHGLIPGSIREKLRTAAVKKLARLELEVSSG